MGADTTSELVILSEKAIIDTISLRPKARIGSLTLEKMQGIGEKNQLLSTLPKKAIGVEFSLPVLSWNDSMIVLTQDSLTAKLPHSITVDSLNPQLLKISYPWVETSTYQLTIFPQGVKGINGKQLQDTLAQKITITHKDQLGNILFTLIPPDSTLQYVVKLLQNKKEVTHTILPQGTTKVEWKLLPPGEYSLELVEDNNANGYWDPGNYLQAQQPERIFVKTLEKLRANWDLEVSWNPTTSKQPESSNQNPESSNQPK